MDDQRQGRPEKGRRCSVRANADPVSLALRPFAVQLALVGELVFVDIDVQFCNPGLEPRPMLGFKSFRCARALIAGIETMHMIKKG